MGSAATTCSPRGQRPRPRRPRDRRPASPPRPGGAREPGRQHYLVDAGHWASEMAGWLEATSGVSRGPGSPVGSTGRPTSQHWAPTPGLSWSVPKPPTACPWSWRYILKADSSRLAPARPPGHRHPARPDRPRRRTLPQLRELAALEEEVRSSTACWCVPVPSWETSSARSPRRRRMCSSCATAPLTARPSSTPGPARPRTCRPCSTGSSR